MRPQVTHTERAGCAPPLPRPRGARGPARPRRLQARAACCRPLLRRPAGPGVGGPQRRDHLQNKDSGLDRATTRRRRRRLPRLRLRPTPTQPPRSGGVEAPRALTNPRGPRRPLSPEPRGEAWRGEHCHSTLPATPTVPPPPSKIPLQSHFLIFQAARVVIFTLGRGPRGAHVGGRWGRGAGAAGLRCKSLSFCGCCSLSPPTAPLHRFSFFLFFSPFLSAAQLLWVTRAVAMGYRTEAGWLATCHPVAAAAAAVAAGGAPGREEAGARVCGTRRGGVCASRRGAAANGRPRVQRRERHHQWGGGKAIKKTRR